MRLAAEFEKHSCISQYVVIDEHAPITVLNKQTIEVAATKYRVAGKEVIRQTPIFFHVGYRMEHGRFYLTGLTESEKNGHPSGTK